MFKLDLEKAEKPEFKLPASVGSSKAREFEKNIYFCLDYAKVFDCGSQQIVEVGLVRPLEPLRILLIYCNNQSHRLVK